MCYFINRRKIKMDRVFMIIIFDEMLSEIKKAEENLIIMNKFN